MQVRSSFLIFAILISAPILMGLDDLKNLPVPEARPPGEEKKITEPFKKPNVNDTAIEPATPSVPQVAQSIPRPMGSAQFEACISQLRSLGAKFKRVSQIDDGNGCGVAHPLRLSALSKRTALSTVATLRCDTALSLAKWTEETARPAAILHLEKDLSEIGISTSYQCRRRNNKPDGKLSEHAFANGVDITNFKFTDNSVIDIKERPSSSAPDRVFQAAVRASACAYFTTVLGPTTDMNHADHLHLDLAQRQGRFRLCQ